MKKHKNLQIWQEAKKKYRLSNEIIQMAQELGLNPKKNGRICKSQTRTLERTSS